MISIFPGESKVGYLGYLFEIILRIVSPLNLYRITGTCCRAITAGHAGENVFVMKKLCKLRDFLSVSPGVIVHRYGTGRTYGYTDATSCTQCWIKDNQAGSYML